MNISVPVSLEGIEIVIDGRRYLAVPLDSAPSVTPPLKKPRPVKKPAAVKKQVPKSAPEPGNGNGKVTMSAYIQSLLKKKPMTTEEILHVSGKSAPSIYSALTLLRREALIESVTVDGKRVNQLRGINLDA